MNDAELVSARETGGDLDREVHGLSEWQAIAFDLLTQGLAFHILHRDVGTAVVLADFINRENVWMVQRRGSACFLKETPPAILL